MKKIKDIEAYILCGGMSQRFGSNKALADLNGRTVIECTASELVKVFDKVTLVTGETKKYEFLNLDCITDLFPGCGPLAGIHASLNNCKTERAFIISCDMPGITAGIISHIVNFKSESGTVIPIANGRKHFLCAVFNKSILPLAEELLMDTKEQPKCASPFDLISISGYDTINFDDLPQFSTESFLNLNTPGDLKGYKSEI